MALTIGKKAPGFTADSDGAGKISLNDYSGKWIVLYFYPKDNTPGCTVEACSFRDNMIDITKQNAVVIGVSPDNVKSHNKFIDKYNLNFHLVSDIEKIICKLYDVIGEKSMFGKKYMGVIRSTYIINPKGIISHVFSQVNVEGHTQEVITKLKEMQS